MTEDVISLASAPATVPISETPVSDAQPVASNVTPAPAPTPVAAPAPAIDWRREMAGDDEKEYQRLQRFLTQKDVYKSFRHLETKQASGELKRTLPANPTPEMLAEYRKEIGLPDNPEDIKLDLGGLLPEQANGQLISDWKSKAHSLNMTPSQINEITKWFLENDEKATIHNKQLTEQADHQRKINAEVELRGEWGADYLAHRNTMENYLTLEYGAEASKFILNSRGADGAYLKDNPAIVRALARVAVTKAPLDKLFVTSDFQSGRGGDDRLAEIQKFMRTNRAEYFKDARMQQEYRDLTEAKRRVAARSVA